MTNRPPEKLIVIKKRMKRKEKFVTKINDNEKK